MCTGSGLLALAELARRGGHAERAQGSPASGHGESVEFFLADWLAGDFPASVTVTGWTVWLSARLHQRHKGFEMMVIIAQLMVNHHKAFGIMSAAVFPGHADAAVQLHRLL